MGNWNIQIRGVGPHHNRSFQDDADRLAAEFVSILKAKGHHVTSAIVTTGREDNVVDPQLYADLRKMEIGG